MLRKCLSRKTAMGFAKGTLDFAKDVSETIVPVLNFYYHSRKIPQSHGNIHSSTKLLLRFNENLASSWRTSFPVLDSYRDSRKIPGSIDSSTEFVLRSNENAASSWGTSIPVLDSYYDSRKILQAHGSIVSSIEFVLRPILIIVVMLLTETILIFLIYLVRATECQYKKKKKQTKQCQWKLKHR